MEVKVHISQFTRAFAQVMARARCLLGCMYGAPGGLSGMRYGTVYSPCFVHDRRFTVYTGCLASIG